MENFKELALPAELQKALYALNFNVPTPIQQLAIPKALTGQDLIGCAQTGSGKTLAFSLPLLARLIANPDQIGLILTPTRELAFQISNVLKPFFELGPRFRGVLVVGGENMHGQIKALAQRPQIIVATPGRLVDHIQRGTVNLDKVGYFVLDEADRMLDMGFAPQLNMILEFLPKTRQTLLFSATMPPDIQRMAFKYLTNPTRVDVAPATEGVSPQIKQKVVQSTRDTKGDDLIKEIQAADGTVIIFTRTKIRTERVARLLHNSGIEAGLIHGDRSQGQRRRAIEGFRRGEFKVLVATDIAARGIDIPSITHVINFDLPQSPEDYIHRIGRTGRAGATGQAISLLTSDDNEVWRAIARMLNKPVDGAPKFVGSSMGSSSSSARRFGAGAGRGAPSKGRFGRVTSPASGSKFGKRPRFGRAQNQ